MTDPTMPLADVESLLGAVIAAAFLAGQKSARAEVVTAEAETGPVEPSGPVLGSVGPGEVECRRSACSDDSDQRQQVWP